MKELIIVKIRTKIISELKILKRIAKQWSKLPSSVFPVARRNCNLCGYYGYFTHFGVPPRLDVMCPNCCSLERHRLLWLCKSKGEIEFCEPILHFAPESVIREKLCILNGYSTADLHERADHKENIESLTFASSSFKTIICNHVLEHVNDSLALSELNRILVPNGELILSFPYIEGWSTTYENSEVVTDVEKIVHFGQRDHVRYYGRDIKQKICSHGFELKEFQANSEEVVNYGLQRGEKVFLCRKIS